MHKCLPWKAPWKPGEYCRFLKGSPIGPCTQVRPGGREDDWMFLARMQDSLYPDEVRANDVGDGRQTAFKN